MGFPKENLDCRLKLGRNTIYEPDRILYLEHGIGNLDYASIDSTDRESLHRIGLTQLLFYVFEILSRPKPGTRTVQICGSLATDPPICAPVVEWF